MNDKYRFVPVSDSSVGVNLPHRLKCIDENVIDVKPEDLKYYNEIRFAWFRMGADLEKIDDDSRIKVNPQTGKCELETNQGGLVTLIVLDRPLPQQYGRSMTYSLCQNIGFLCSEHRKYWWPIFVFYISLDFCDACSWPHSIPKQRIKTLQTHNH